MGISDIHRHYYDQNKLKIYDIYHRFGCISLKQCKGMQRLPNVTLRKGRSKINQYLLALCSEPVTPPPLVHLGLCPQSEIRPCPHRQRQCKIFASGVDFSKNNAIYK